jgi:hypothetical protein
VNIILSTFVTQDSMIVGTSLQGYLSASYDELESQFGKPCGSFEKASATWLLRLGDTIITIYDSVSEGFENLPQQRGVIRQWHIGGVKPGVVGIVAALLGKNVTGTAGRPLVEA